MNDPALEQATNRTEHAILEAEKFKAQLIELPGKDGPSIIEFNNDLPMQLTNMCQPKITNQVISQLGAANNNTQAGNQINHQVGGLAAGSRLSDDDFFHLTCHIDPALKQKIEKGEFVDLDKFLPRDRISALNGSYNDDSRMEWVQRDGSMFLVPARKESRINRFCRWEQAFRLYASIYCDKNPFRAKEIWQYISVIQTASTAYVWENVYGYDIVFRQLMAFNPNRSWAVTYNQMWNLSMREPIVRNRAGNNQTNTNTSRPTSNGKKKSNKSDYCWNFNKSVKCKFGNKCRFIECCNFCDSPTHGIHACHKYKKSQAAASDKKLSANNNPAQSSSTSNNNN